MCNSLTLSLTTFKLSVHQLLGFSSQAHIIRVLMWQLLSVAASLALSVNRSVLTYDRQSYTDAVPHEPRRIHCWQHDQRLLNVVTVVSVSCWPVSGLCRPRQTTHAVDVVYWVARSSQTYFSHTVFYCFSYKRRSMTLVTNFVHHVLTLTPTALYFPLSIHYVSK